LYPPDLFETCLVPYCLFYEFLHYSKQVLVFVKRSGGYTV
jgi:hypothetical protein